MRGKYCADRCTTNCPDCMTVSKEKSIDILNLGELLHSQGRLKLSHLAFNWVGKILIMFIIKATPN